jgi:outer membrane usher protein FimD/PapC
MNRNQFSQRSAAAVISLALATAGMAIPTLADAAPTRTSVNNSNGKSGRSTNTNSNKTVNNNSNRNVNVNNNSNKNVNVNNNSSRNVNVNSNKNVNVNVDVDHDDHHHPVGTALAVGATVAVTAAVIGSMTPTLPPACTVVIANGITYQQCGSTWYQPQYVGSSVQYVVVAPIR